jgi:hypothetical protein
MPMFATENQTKRNAILEGMERQRTPEQREDAKRLRAERRAYELLPNDAKKAQNERQVFEEFSRVANLDIDLNSVAQCPIPEPDIRCDVNGSPRYFELGEITDEVVAQSLARTRPGTFFPCAYSQEDPFKYLIEKKQSTTYRTDGLPVDLLMYYRKQGPPLQEHFQQLMRKYDRDLAALRQRFHRIWIFDFTRKEILLEF